MENLTGELEDVAVIYMTKYMSVNANKVEKHVSAPHGLDQDLAASRQALQAQRQDTYTRRARVWCAVGRVIYFLIFTYLLGSDDLDSASQGFSGPIQLLFRKDSMEGASTRRPRAWRAIRTDRGSGGSGAPARLICCAAAWPRTSWCATDLLRLLCCWCRCINKE